MHHADLPVFFYVSIHVPLAEHDATTSIRGADMSSFNSRAPRGARPINGTQKADAFIVSIHVPLAEHDFT